ncbi:MAG TPA: IPT/TIG domain-containing protein, partial [Myxococcota bacterium]|nr:IPT/TIG domain-containing protein [Myxococcota bacterium]
GGNTITIEGKGFLPGATVKVGNNAATDVRVLGPQAITATAPAGLGAGLVEVRVELPEDAPVATRVAFLEDAYRYLPDAP